MYTEAKKVRNTWLWDVGASDEYKGTLILSALEHMCDTIIWFYGSNYKGDMASIVRQFRNKRKTMDQKRKFTRPNSSVTSTSHFKHGLSVSLGK